MMINRRKSTDQSGKPEKLHSKTRTYLIRMTWAIMAFLLLYGIGRLYYYITDGFTIAKITSDLTYDPRRETHPLSDEEVQLIDSILSQEFHYIGKGCQSYVFLSNDGEYVIKFFKYQRMRPKEWLKNYSFLPFIDEYRLRRSKKKNAKLQGLFESCKIAFDHLPLETGMVYVHLNKTDHLKKLLTIYDKMGFAHSLDIDKYEFMIQKKATMICDHIETLMKDGLFEEASSLLKKFVNRVLSEYERGIADNDHALMQNTGVHKGEPIHVDVGQFVIEEAVKDRKFHMQELFTKTYKFRLWLKETYPRLCQDFDDYLSDVIGEEFETMQPYWRNRIEIFQDDNARVSKFDFLKFKNPNFENLFILCASDRALL